MSRREKFKKLEHKIELISLFCFISKNKENTIEDEKYVSIPNRVNDVLHSLTQVEKDFITNEFFDDVCPYWWEEIYSRSTYYRYKRTAMEKFLKAFYYEK